MPFVARVNRKLKEEQKKQKIKEEPIFYIDRDRAAAVVIGSKDIKSELKVCEFILFRESITNS